MKRIVSTTPDSRKPTTVGSSSTIAADMGMPKQLLEFCGGSLIRRAASVALGAGCRAGSGGDGRETPRRSGKVCADSNYVEAVQRGDLLLEAFDTLFNKRE